MAIGYFVERPEVVPAIMWDGSNYEEVRQYMQAYQSEDNGDGTLTVHSYVGDFVLQTGDYVQVGGFPVRAENYQQVSGPAVDYVVE